ncbi:nitrite reductase small subunit NirD [Micromonospora zhanjiangensis]
MSVAPTAAGPVAGTTRWVTVCRLADLLPERGAAALLDGTQVAVFRLHDDGVRAIGNHDPLSGAYVLSRGIVGTRGDRAVVASPMHKQAYDLDTGHCLDVPDVAVPVYPARVRGGLVEVAVR